MRRYKLIKDRIASHKEVFENLKGGGLKLLCFNKITRLWSQVAWCSENQIEVITLENDKIVANYFMYFPYNDLFQLKLNTKFFNNKTWCLGYIED